MDKCKRCGEYKDVDHDPDDGRCAREWKTSYKKARIREDIKDIKYWIDDDKYEIKNLLEQIKEVQIKIKGREKEIKILQTQLKRKRL